VLGGLMTFLDHVAPMPGANISIFQVFFFWLMLISRSRSLSIVVAIKETAASFATLVPKLHARWN